MPTRRPTRGQKNITWDTCAQPAHTASPLVQKTVHHDQREEVRERDNIFVRKCTEFAKLLPAIWTTKPFGSSLLAQALWLKTYRLKALSNNLLS